MSLQRGTKLGSYEVAALIGVGGMGEVYRATDTRLGREVALKVLPEAFVGDADRLARFEREAKALASLNHPHIASIYGLEESSGTPALVLEYVEGQTLDERIAQGPIPIKEAIGLALQIASALEAAHEHGVVHRDLKPANIKLKPDGNVKVLDFGLAKAFQTDDRQSNVANSPSLSMAATQQGLILGTAAYMAPEQAKGRAADKRADIWAFGCVLSEMLSGRPAFPGDDVSEVLASVLKADPDWSGLPGDVHPKVREILGRCLEKDPRKRYRDIGDVAADLGRLLEEPAALLASVAATRSSRGRVGWLGVTATAAVAALVAWIAWPVPELPVTRFSIDVAAGATNNIIGLSPDGRRFAYAADSRLYVRAMDQSVATAIPGTDGTTSPFFSHDGKSLAFFTATQLMRTAIPGGVPSVVADVALQVRGLAGSWDATGRIIFGIVGRAPLYQVPAAGGTPGVIAALGDYADVDYPDVLPGGDWLIFTALTSGNWSTANIVAQSIATGERKVLIEGGFFARYAPTGHLLFMRNGTLMAAGFDADRVAVTTGVVPMVPGVVANEQNGVAGYAISRNGTLAYRPASETPYQNRVLALVTREGAIERLKLPPKEYLNPRVSPDGSALAVQSVEGDHSVIWVQDLTSDQAPSQLTLEGDNQRPVWTPDGERIVFSSDRGGSMSLYWMRADGSGPAERLTTAEGSVRHWAGSWTPDGKTLLFNAEGGGAAWSIHTLSLDDRTTRPLHEESGMAYLNAELSRDGRWLAFSAGPIANTADVYVEPFPPDGSRFRVSQNLGYYPLWSPDGSELFYRSNVGEAQVTLRSVDVSFAPRFGVSSERVFPAEDFTVVQGFRNYDVDPKGDRMLIVFPEDSGPTARVLQINVVLNWFEELKERVPVP